MKLVTIKKRFKASHSDEMGSYGTYVEELAVTEEDGRFICWISELKTFLKTPMAGLFDVEPMTKLIEKCK